MFLGIQLQDDGSEHIAHVTETFEALDAIRYKEWVETVTEEVQTGETKNEDGTISPILETVSKEVERTSGYLPLDEIRETEDVYIRVNNRWVLDDGVALGELKVLKLAEINDEFEKRAKLPRTETPENEVLTWDIQKNEAEGWQADDAFPTPMIDLIAENRGMDRVVLLGKVLEKVQAYRDYVGALMGRRQGYEDEIKGATSRAVLEAIVWVD